MFRVQMLASIGSSPSAADAIAQVECQFLEIHNDDIRDLLHPRAGAGCVRRPATGLALRFVCRLLCTLAVIASSGQPECSRVSSDEFHSHRLAAQTITARRDYQAPLRV